ncbi:hypothetical protein [Deinococcus sp.]|uniref:hypothetical protein n=1 Tax=Deinococcus sp. TaxID=47478 RepID=UPI003C7E1C7F
MTAEPAPRRALGRAPGAPGLRLSDLAGRRLLGAALVLVVLYHGVLLFNQQFVHTYDALIHIFFASHYAQNWFDPWEPRWYTGFSLVSYPPLSHQLIALLSKLVGLKPAFAWVQLLALLNLTVGLYRFATLLVPARAAGYACLALALSSSLSETVQVFGQLPTTLSLGFLLHAIPFGWSYVKTGHSSDLIKGVLWVGATTAGHHVTTLFGSVFFMAPALMILVLAAFRTPRPDEPQGVNLLSRARRRLYRVLPRFYRAGVFACLSVGALVIVVLPYWLWSRADPITQVSIPHGSRENFITHPNFGLMFWLIPWASTLLFLPYALYKGWSWRWPVAASLGLLFVLGTGGTTPIPKLLLRSAYDILTLDRFTFWATMLILPFVGLALESAVHGRLGQTLDALLGRRVRLLLLLGTLALACAVSIAISTLTTSRKFQPSTIDIAPIVTFIEKDQHWRYRYLTLGFGDQMAWLSANTRASTPDGNYHSARRLPELTTTPIERLEGAKYTGVPGIGSLTQFLTIPEKYNLKFIFSNDAFYDPALYFAGWHRLGVLEDGVMVWEREDIPPLPERLPRKELPVWQRLMWGVLPLGACIAAFLSLLLPRFRLPLLPWQRRGPLARLHRWLREDALPEEPASGWQPWRRFVRPWTVRPRRPARQRLLLSGLLLAGLALPLALVAARAVQVPNTPQATLLAYWDDVDFKRFHQAYRQLAPEDGLSEDRWMLDLSVQGGVRTGYAKLDAITVPRVSFSGDPARPGARASAEVHLKWFTALGDFEETRRQQLIRTPQGWRILTRPVLQIRPPERFTGQAAVTYYRAPRRLTVSATDAGDVLDRPRLRVLSSRLVAYTLPAAPSISSRVRLEIVGELENIGARPADVTVTGVLRRRDGSEAARNNAGDLTLHKLLPGERTPFVVVYDGVTAGVDSPLDPQQIGGFDVFAKAVVTGRDLDRDLAAWSRPQHQEVALRLVNVGTSEATVPQALLAVHDGQGVQWVGSAYSLEAVPPREERDLSVPSALPTGYRVLLRGPTWPGAAAGPFPLPDGRTYSLSLREFERSP